MLRDTESHRGVFDKLDETAHQLFFIATKNEEASFCLVTSKQSGLQPTTLCSDTQRQC